MSIGANGFVGTGSIIVAAERVVIGEDALIAAYVTIRDQDHRLDDCTVPTNRQGLVTAPIEIGANVWIGTKATILRGVTIGDGAVVAAHSIVNAPVERLTVVGGIPAKLLKRRDAR
jgi:acetyltransferase-like isoleucine patch superfamily enzyme